MNNNVILYPSSAILLKEEKDFLYFLHRGYIIFVIRWEYTIHFPCVNFLHPHLHVFDHPFCYLKCLCPSHISKCYLYSKSKTNAASSMKHSLIFLAALNLSVSLKFICTFHLEIYPFLSCVDYLNMVDTVHL